MIYCIYYTRIDYLAWSVLIMLVILTDLTMDAIVVAWASARKLIEAIVTTSSIPAR